MPIVDGAPVHNARTSSLSRAYDEHGSHFIEEIDGKYSITFLYRPSESDRSIDQEVELDCPDLYDEMLDDNGKPRKFTRDPSANMYSLRIDTVSSDTFATYQIKVNETVISPPDTQRLLTMHHLDLHTDPVSIAQQKTEYIQLPEAKVPSCFNLELPSTLKGSVTLDTFKPSEQFPMFPERDTWVYKPSGFDKLDPKKEKSSSCLMEKIFARN